MTRRGLLALAAAVVIAGCAGPGEEAQPAATPTAPAPLPAPDAPGDPDPTSSPPPGERDPGGEAPQDRPEVEPPTPAPAGDAHEAEAVVNALLALHAESVLAVRDAGGDLSAGYAAAFPAYTGQARNWWERTTEVAVEDDFAFVRHDPGPPRFEGADVVEREEGCVVVVGRLDLTDWLVDDAESPPEPDRHDVAVLVPASPIDDPEGRNPTGWQIAKMLWLEPDDLEGHCDDLP